MKFDDAFIARFWSKVDRAGKTNNDCWNWTGGISNGYGKIGYHGKNLSAHRVAYELQYGPLPDGLYACHKCDNKRCCNPYHLFPGTNQDNQVDAVNKGLLHPRKGQASGTAKLSAKQVIEIRTRYASGITRDILAKAYHVSPAEVTRIVRGDLWKDAGGPITKVGIGGRTPTGQMNGNSKARRISNGR